MNSESIIRQIPRWDVALLKGEEGAGPLTSQGNMCAQNSNLRLSTGHVPLFVRIHTSACVSSMHEAIEEVKAFV